MNHIDKLIRPALLLASVFLLGGCGSDHSSDKVQLWEGGPYWAVKNIGAEKPWESGLYFWWGDTVGYRREGDAWVASDGSSSSFSFKGENAPTFATGSTASYLKSEGWVVLKDGTYVLAPEHDAAHVHWGDSWRMPTKKELKDLNEKCDWEWTVMNGMYGYVVRGRDDYSSANIFLPAGGGGHETSLFRPCSFGIYGTSVPASDPYNSNDLFFDPENHGMFFDHRYNGFSVRPVQAFAKETKTTKRMVREKAEAAYKAAEAASKSKVENARRNIEHVKVQLWKDGPYWADMNIGAENPEDYGLYFWWGDTVGYRREGNAWVASDGSSSDFSFEEDNTPTYDRDYSTLQSEGRIVIKDGTYVLAPEHDAARVHWGGSWRMPTKRELEDLNNKCDWTWTTRNGVNGCVVSGRGDYSSSSIFIPAAGLDNTATPLSLAGSNGYYWSSVPSQYSIEACGLRFHSDDHYTQDHRRCWGQSVRPVQGFAE